MTAVQQIAVLWTWDDGTRCVLCGLSGVLELRVLRNGRTLKRHPVTDLLHAIHRSGPELELECAHDAALVR